MSSGYRSTLEGRDAEDRDVVQTSSGHHDTSSSDPSLDSDDTGMHTEFEPRYRGIIAYTTLVSTLGGFNFGYSTGVIAGALVSIEDDFEVSTFVQGLVTAAVLLGAVVGSMVSGQCADRWGRKPVLLWGSIIFGVGGTLFSTFAPSVATIGAARVVVGIAVGVYSFVAPLYTSECAPAKYRGRLVIVFQLMVTFSIFVAYLINLAFVDTSSGWRYMFLLGVVPMVLNVVVALMMPESPRWLVVNHRVEEARPYLSQIVGPSRVDEEIDSIIQTSKADVASWAEVFSPRLSRHLIIGLVLCVANQLTGINAIIYFAPKILENAGFEEGFATSAVTASVGFWNFVATFGAIRYIDSRGRRFLMLLGLVIMCVSIGVLAVAFLTFGDSNTAMPPVALICIFVYVTGFEFGPGPLFFVIVSEIYPEKVRGRAASMITAVQWVLNLLLSLFFLPAVEAINEGPTFLIFCAVCFGSALVLRIILPETKGKTLDEVQILLRGDAKILTEDMPILSNTNSPAPEP